MGNSTGNADKKNLRKQAKTIKQRKDAGTCRDKKKKRQHKKNNNSTWENKPESTGERRKIKKKSTKGKTIQTKPDIQKQRKEILPTNRRRWHENMPTTGCKRNRRILD